MTARSFAYQQLDVFTSTPLEGNMLAVFTDARGLSDDEAKKIYPEGWKAPRPYLRIVRQPN